MSDSSATDGQLELDDALVSRLRAHLQRSVGDLALAEDLTQETLLRATAGISGYAGTATVKTWLFSIASRVVADHFRSPERRARIVEISESEEPRDGAPPLEERLIADEMNNCVREVVDSLPPSYRDALLLHEFEEMTAGEVAEVLNCSVATAKIRIHRARGRLHEALGKSCSFYRDASDTFRCDRKP